MATVNPVPEPIPSPSRTGAELLVTVSAMAPEKLESLLTKLTTVFAAEELLIATPDATVPESYPGLRIVAMQAGGASWALTAVDFANARQLAQANEARAILMLGPESDSLSPSALRDLGNAIAAGVASSADLAVPYYHLPPRAGLVNSAILFPLSRALFASRVRFPQAIDLGLSLRMAERLAAASQRFPSTNQDGAFLWPVNEAVTAGFTVRELDAGTRALPQPTEADLNTILAMVAGSLFADIDAKAAFWQRARTLPPVRPMTAAQVSAAHTGDAEQDIAPMLEAFRLAYVNLREIWSLVLPPNTLLGLKRLYTTDAAAFRMPEGLWARIIYDFVVAYRLRTINRGHLLGALTPLYLAWVASHINTIALGTEAESHIEQVTAAFEADKPYLVSRWRWPDRFNP
jgi:hypothetical protein